MGHVPAGRKETVDFAPLGGGDQPNGRVVISAAGHRSVDQNVRIKDYGHDDEGPSSEMECLLLVLLMGGVDPGLRVCVEV